MTNKIYLIKNLSPWMLDELVSFSKFTNYTIIFLREPNSVYQETIEKIVKKGVTVYIKPFKRKFSWKKNFVFLYFFLANIFRFSINYNGVIGLKSIYWFLKLDMSKIPVNSSIHAQFATQPALISYLIKLYYNQKLEYSFTFHAHDIYINNKWFNLLVKNSKVAFSISEYNMSYVKNKYINSPKIVLSRLGVFAPDDIQISKTTYHEFCIGIMSWFVEKKGIIYLLQAFKKLQKKGITNIKLRLAGDGPLKSQFLEFIGNNQLKNVEFVGKVYGAQKEKFFKSLDAFVLPSISLSNDMDGIPVVLMEAISYGLPIISTNISGIPEICINNYNGYLVEEKNITQLASSIIKLASQDNELFKENSLKLSEQYDIVVNSKNKLVKLNWI